MVYYTEADLKEISIHKYDNLLIQKLGTADVDEIEVDDETFFPFTDADVFRQGTCQLFAYALKKTFGYDASY